MASLPATLRRRLEKVIVEARDVAEAGARAAVERLAVGRSEPFAEMAPAERELRVKLRAHARQLGDLRKENGEQEILHLVSECGYEHWHRMLFARFLAENHLLIHPEHGVPVTLAECEELAAEAREPNGWALAGRFAARMLPAIFRPDDSVLAVRLAPEHQQALEKLLAELPIEAFTADDSLGWAYQFWQTTRKKQVNDSGKKIGADELPAVTQLFTEPYMVQFLLDNTLGAWWAGKTLKAHPEVAATAASEDELRRACALPGCEWTYLRFVREQESGPWRPAAGTFGGWPERASELTVLDPCCGSGHFLVEAFRILVPLRMAEEGLTARDACDAVIRENLFGLEIDPRCTQIGAFNLALAAWRGVGHCKLPAMNLACCGLSPNARKADWLALAGGDEKLKNGMERLYRLFKDAPVLGSLINPRAGGGDLLVAEFHELQPLLEKALARETKDDAAHEMAVTARGLAKAAEILAGQFTLVATNVPFLGYREMGDELLAHVSSYFANEKGDLGYCLWRRFGSFVSDGTTTALVTLQHWLSLRSYRELRRHLLSRFELSMISHLGTGAFETISGEKVNVTLTVATKSPDSMEASIALVDAAKCKAPSEKTRHLIDGHISVTAQQKQFSNPDHRISFGALTNLPSLSKYADCLAGIMNGDSLRFVRSFWEIPRKIDMWAFLQSTVSRGTEIGGLESLIFFDEANGHLREEASVRRVKLHNADERGNAVWGRAGVAISQMSSLPASRYFGNKYDSNVASIVPRKSEHLAAIWTFCSSEAFYDVVRAIDRKLNVTNATFGKVPFDLAHWQKVAAEKYPHGLPRPFSTDPTQWLFDGHPANADHPLQVAVARLLGYRWPRQTGSSFPDCPALDADGLETLADDDGIVCIPPVRGEQPAADRLHQLLSNAFGAAWIPEKLAALLGEAGLSGRTLEEWLRDGFFEQHCQLFHQRPFVWHIWDGRRRDGFSALVDYHKLDRKLLERLTYAVLGDWIVRQRQDLKADERGSGDRLAAAEELQKKLALILEGEPPYDVFVRWKPLHEQPVGWEPDLNDGVRMNIRPFVEAGVLRKTPSIKWSKDRGAESESLRPRDQFPWFWKEGKFTGERVNDVHLTHSEKRSARERSTPDKRSRK